MSDDLRRPLMSLEDDPLRASRPAEDPLLPANASAVEEKKDEDNADGPVADAATAEEPRERDYFPQARPPRTSLLVRVVRELGGSWANTVGTVLINVPQVVAALVMLMVFSSVPHYGDDDVQDDTSRHTGTDFHDAEANARRWIGVNAVRLTLTTYVVAARFIYVEMRGWDEHATAVRYLTNARNGLELIKIIWFVIGNMWIFPGMHSSSGADDDCPGCEHTPVYWFCVAMIGVQYFEIFFFCILAILLVPVFCFCLPCFVRFLAALHDPMDGKGADPKVIDQLPLMSYREPVRTCADEESAESAEEKEGCPICLGDFVNGDEVRLLPCKHQFHRGCVDQWLMVNATCPSCRASILPDDGKKADPRAAAEE